MNKYFNEYITTRCEEALSKNENYMNIQKRMSEAYQKNDIELYSELSASQQLVVQNVTYRVAAGDILSFVIDD